MTFLAYHAWDTAHAIVLTLVRLTITRRRLLEWETAATTAARAAGIVGGRALLRFVVRHGVEPDHRARRDAARRDDAPTGAVVGAARSSCCG